MIYFKTNKIPVSWKTTQSMRKCDSQEILRNPLPIQTIRLGAPFKNSVNITVPWTEGVPANWGFCMLWGQLPGMSACFSVCMLQCLHASVPACFLPACFVPACFVSTCFVPACFSVCMLRDCMLQCLHASCLHVSASACFVSACFVSACFSVCMLQCTHASCLHASVSACFSVCMLRVCMLQCLHASCLRASVPACFSACVLQCLHDELSLGRWSTPCGC